MISSYLTNSFYGERYFPLPKALTSKSNKWDLDMIPIVLLLPCWMWQINRKVESKCTLQNSRAVLYFLLFWGKSTKIDPKCKEICPSGPDCFISWRWTLSWRPVFSQRETPEQTEILVRDERPFVSLIHPQNSCPSILHACERIESLYAPSLTSRHALLRVSILYFKHLCSRWCYHPSLETLALFEGFLYPYIKTWE